MSQSAARKPRRWKVYVVRCSDGSLYTGIATDTASRLAAHNAGKGAKCTRARLPVELVWKSAPLTETSARKREYAFKQLSRQEKLAFLSEKAAQASAGRPV